MGYANPDAVTQIANGLSTKTFAYDNNGEPYAKTTDGVTTTYAISLGTASGYSIARRIPFRIVMTVRPNPESASHRIAKQLEERGAITKTDGISTPGFRICHRISGHSRT
jgi:hypothetical protein